MKLYFYFCLLFCSLFQISISGATVAAIQLRSEHVGNFQEIQLLVKEAKRQGAELAILPEESLFGWLNPEVFLKAEPIPGPYSDAFAQIAKKEAIWLAVGLAERASCDSSHEGLPNVYNAAILINPQGEIVLHHRQVNVIKNAFDPDACNQILCHNQIGYLPGDSADIALADTPFGKTVILVCADAYPYGSAEPLKAVKKLSPDFVIILWGITACSQEQEGFCYPLDFTAATARYLGNPLIVGVNATGPRNYGRFLPSHYCGMSACTLPSGKMLQAENAFAELVFFSIDLPIEDAASYL